MDQIKAAVKIYQCPGCIGEGYEVCYQKGRIGVGCNRHNPGTISSRAGTIMLGLPHGFDKTGGLENFRPQIFLSVDDLIQEWSYDKYDIPIWKYLDRTTLLIRGFQPRLNRGFVHIILSGDFSQIKCIELTNNDLEAMD